MNKRRRKFLQRALALAGGLFVAKPGLGDSGSRASAIVTPKHSPTPLEWDNDRITMAWIGHSTVLINFFGVWILTDPVFSQRIGVYFLGMNLGPARYSHPALDFDQLPKPDLLLLSHAHMDHMDYPTLKRFAAKYPDAIDFITAANTKDVVQSLRWRTLRELDWNEELNYRGIELRALKVRHFGWRFPWEKDRRRGYTETGRSYNAYRLRKNGKQIVFGGDTAMCDDFKQLQHELVDVAIMPIGAYEPWRSNHCTPEEALEMASHMNARIFVPIHTNTFYQGREPLNEPMQRLRKASADFADMRVGIKGLGQTLVV